jgi:transposase
MSKFNSASNPIATKLATQAYLPEVFTQGHGLMARMLGINDPWYVDSITIDQAELTMTVHVACKDTLWIENGAPCAIHGYVDRTWRHLHAFQYKTLIKARVPRVRIPVSNQIAGLGQAPADQQDDEDDSCGGAGSGAKRPFKTKCVSVPWADQSQQITRLLEDFAILVLQSTKSIQAASKLLDLGWQALYNIMERAVDRGQLRREECTVYAASIDEKYFGKTNPYATVVCDLTRRCVVEVGPGRDTESAKQVLLDAFSEKQRDGVMWVTQDFSTAFTKATKEMLPLAVQVYDKFHISALFNKAMGEVRKSEQRDMKANDLIDEAKDLKGTRFLLMQNFEDMNEDETTRLQAALDANERVAAVWKAKEDFHLIWECSSEAAGKKYFEQWHQRVKSMPELAPLKRVAKTMAKHLDGVLAWITCRLTNAFLEGMNSLIQAMSAGARGFRSVGRFRIRILFLHGKLDLATGNH